MKHGKRKVIDLGFVTSQTKEIVRRAIINKPKINKTMTKKEKSKFQAILDIIKGKSKQNYFQRRGVLNFLRQMMHWLGQRLLMMGNQQRRKELWSRWIYIFAEIQSPTQMKIFNMSKC